MKIGLALSGGVGRAAAHIGVLQVLAEAGLSPDLVAGVSAGAIIGYGYCAGVSLRLWREISYQIGWANVAELRISSDGLVSFDPLEQWLVDLLGDLHFSDLPRPFIVIATDIDTGRPFVIEQGPVAPAVHASCAVPGFVPPVALFGRRLVDGGASSNLPAGLLKDRGMDYVIGVDLFRPSTQWPIGSIRFGMTGIEMLVRQSGGGLDACDCLISPALSGVSYFDMNNAEKLIQLGAEAARAALPQIQADLRSFA